jgi:2-iminoacetate synthase
MSTVNTGDWLRNRIKEDEIARYLNNGRDFIDDKAMRALLADTTPPDPVRVREILAKSFSVTALTPEETAVLLKVEDPDLRQEMEQTAFAIKKKVYDNRIVTFAPLYTSNRCVNNCLYCGFRSGNTDAVRRILTQDEVRRETEVLAGDIGHKRLIMVYGEHPDSDIDYMVDTLKTVYGVHMKTRSGSDAGIRRVNINAAPMDVASLKRLKEAGIGTYQVFQETYDRDVYSRLHPKGTLKSHYQWRLYCMHRAYEAGIDDVGIGVLFGLADWRFEMLGLVYHAAELERVFGVGPHTISFPRLEPAANAPYSAQENRISDDDFRKIITIIRLAVPYTGMIITAREGAAMRRTAVTLGVTQTDASSRIGIGAYNDHSDKQKQERQQFLLGDTRSLDELIREFAQMGLITSFCTAGYRCGRTGECIMDLLKTGQEGRFCKLNAIVTFREWLDDFASEETRRAGEQVILSEMEEVRQQMPQAYPLLEDFYHRTSKGERDLYF